MKKDRKVLIIVENNTVPVDTRVWQEATTLVKNGYTVSVICPKGKGYDTDEETLEDVHIFRHNMPLEGNGLFCYVKEYFLALHHERKLAKKVYKMVGFDVIHGSNPPDNIYLIAKKYRKYGVKYVFDQHDICPEMFETKFGTEGMLKKLLYKSQLVLERQTFRHCDLAFVTNKSFKHSAVRRNKINPQTVFVLRNGPDLKRIKIQPPIESLKQGKKYMIGYLGVIGNQEGIEYILEAAQYCRNTLKRDDIHWCICGDGTHLNHLKMMCTAMKLDDCVEFLGFLPVEKWLDYLNTADVCVSSDPKNSMNDKSTMIKIMEYMALAKPIIQFDLTEGRYSAQKASLYAENNSAEDMAQKIVQLLEHPEQCKEMGEYGRNRVLKVLSWEHTSKVLLEGYEKMFS